jgi:hypothetical protein
MQAFESDMKRAAKDEIKKDANDEKKVKPEAKYFEGFDFNDFWGKKKPAGPTLTDEMVRDAEKAIGYTLPPSYIAFLKYHNGGSPKQKTCSASTPTSWAKNHIAIDTIQPIGGDDGIEEDQENWFDEWEYPRIGVVIAQCPSGGHDLVMLDYTGAGIRNNLEKIRVAQDGQGEKEAAVRELGEPRVVHVDQDRDFKVTVLAKDFETWIRELKTPQEFGGEPEEGDDDDDDEQ